MKTNNIYKGEIKAARRLFAWVDAHPYLTNIILAAAGVVCAAAIFMCYPL